MITGGHGATTPGLTRALEGLPLSLLMNAIAAERLPADPRWSHGRLRYRAARGLIPSTRDAGRLWFSLGDVHTIAATTRRPRPRRARTPWVSTGDRQASRWPPEHWTPEIGLAGMTSRPTFTVTAERHKRWWILQCVEHPGAVSQVRRLDQAADTIREAIAWVAQIPEDSFDVDVKPAQ